jgi:farnesol dehydrogenase
MTKVFVTGSTGFIGSNLCNYLHDQGFHVLALARNRDRANTLLDNGIEIVDGIIDKIDAIKRKLDGCEYIFHLAAKADPWSKNPKEFYDINVSGTDNLLNIAKEVGVRRVVVTSTVGVLGASDTGDFIDENAIAPEPLDTEYDRTKLLAEKMIRARCKDGENIVIVNPSRVFGPGPLTKANSLTQLIKSYDEGKWRYILGDGNSIGNYVYVKDVIRGMHLAAERGKIGERYILGGENMSFNELFDLFKLSTGKHQRMIHVPLSLIMTIAKSQEFFANIFGRPPMITPAFVRKFSKDWKLSIEKANRELGYKPTSLSTAIEETVQWLRNSN